MRYYNFSKMRSSLGIIANWTYALNQNGELSEVLDQLVQLVKADAAMLVRTSKLDNKTKYVARSDNQKGKVWPTQSQSHAEVIVGEFIATARAGPIWKLSDALSSNPGNMPAATAGRYNNIAEGVICPLESTRTYFDYIELHFISKPLEHDLNLLTILMGTFADGWQRRAPASISKKLLQKRNVSLVSPLRGRLASILSSDNPAHLSRSEYRVCALLAEGMTVQHIAQTLSICPATVRSHLSAVFSKTETTSQIELLHLLNTKSEGPATATGYGLA